MITSVHNPKIQWVRALQARSRNRREEHSFIIEGVRLAEEALHSGWEAGLVLHTAEVGDRGLQVVEAYLQRGTPVEQVTPHVFQAVSATETPQGILVVLPEQTVALPDTLDFVLILDEIRDPGNLGTILRTALAAGCDSAILLPGAVDPYSPKVVRAAMGAHFRLPILEVGWGEIGQLLEQHNLQAFLATAGEGQAYTQADFRQPLALIIGSEARGASPQAQGLAGQPVHIPMPGKIESLNAAIAAGILLFEVVRQRNP